MNLIFQFGEFFGTDGGFLTDLLISAVGSFIGIIGAYYLYVFGINETRRDRLKYFVSLLQSIIPTCKAQAEYCKSAAEIQEKYKLNFPIIKIGATHDLKRIAERIDQESVFHAYFSKYIRKEGSYKDVKNIFSYIDHLEMLMGELKPFAEKAQNGIWNRKRDFAMYFEEVKLHIERIIVNPSFINDPKLNHYITKFSSFMEAFYQNSPEEGENVAEAMNDVLKPTKNYIISINMPQDELTILLQHCNKAINTYIGIERMSEVNARDLKLFGESFNSSTTALEIATKQLFIDFPPKRTRFIRRLNPFKL